MEHAEPGRKRMRSPQEKKALSYARDRRNSYGENDKSSRKNIPLRKRRVNKANRHADRQALTGATADSAETAERALLAGRRKKWQKWRDEPLGVHVARLRTRNAELAARSAPPPMV